MRKRRWPETSPLEIWKNQVWSRKRRTLFVLFFFALKSVHKLSMTNSIVDVDALQESTNFVQKKKKTLSERKWSEKAASISVCLSVSSFFPLEFSPLLDMVLFKITVTFLFLFLSFLLHNCSTRYNFAFFFLLSFFTQLPSYPSFAISIIINSLIIVIRFQVKTAK